MNFQKNQGNEAINTPQSSQSHFVEFDNWRQNDEYVLWVDIMGTGSLMTLAHQRSILAVAKLHLTVIQSINFFKELKKKQGHESSKIEGSRLEIFGIKFYPMSDGAYICTQNAEDLKMLISILFKSIVKSFNQSRKHSESVIIRGAVSKGMIMHGCNIGTDVNELLHSKLDQYTNRLVFGPALGFAHAEERKAPPFGIAIAPSARGDKFSGLWYSWFRGTDQALAGLASQILNNLEAHFEWTKQNPHSNPYPEDRLKEHLTWAKEYFSNVGNDEIRRESPPQTA